MRAIEVKVLSTDEGKTEDFDLRVETLRGDTWVNVQSLAMTSGTEAASRRIVLEASERIVIVGRGAQEDMVFDKVQNAAMPRSSFESQPSDAEKAQMLADHQAELKSGARADVKVQRAGDQAAEKARDTAIESAKLRMAEEARRKAVGAAVVPPVKPTPNPVPAKPVPGVGGTPSGSLK